jgi:hypothetical protein
LWGCIIAALITFPLVFGWLMFESLPEDLHSYRIYVFGFPTIAFKVESILAFLLFHGLGCRTCRGTREMPEMRALIFFAHA